MYSASISSLCMKRIRSSHTCSNRSQSYPQLGLSKMVFYNGGAGDFRNMADARGKAEHQAKRKMLAHVFAQKTIANLELVIMDTIAVLVAQIDEFAGEGRPINMRRYPNYFTIDVFPRLLYRESLGCLDRENQNANAETPDGKVYQVPLYQVTLQRDCHEYCAWYGSAITSSLMDSLPQGRCRL